MRIALKEKKIEKKVDDRLHKATYLRGIDGQGPTNLLRQNDQADETKGSDRQGQSSIERPDGPGQFDYLRRLAKSLEKIEKKA